MNFFLGALLVKIICFLQYCLFFFFSKATSCKDPKFWFPAVFVTNSLLLKHNCTEKVQHAFYFSFAFSVPLGLDISLLQRAQAAMKSDGIFPSKRINLILFSCKYSQCLSKPGQEEVKRKVGLVLVWDSVGQHSVYSFLL